MSAQTVTKKRKSVDGAAATTKKAKTAKSAEKPAPAKSALKKEKDETVVEEKKTKPGKAVKTKAAKKTDGAGDAKAAAVTKEIVEDDDNDDAEGSKELTADQTAELLAGFSSSGDENSDDEEEEGIAMEKLPQAPRMKDIQKRIQQATASDPERSPGIIYIGRLPHGFYEPQLRGYLSQFGEILHLRLARNRKSGKSQHYAFVEFASLAVAEIVAKSMDKYLLFGHILQVRIVPREQVKENIFDGATRRRKPVPRNRLEGRKLMHGKEREVWDRKVEREEKRRAGKQEKLRELGYEFEMPGVKAVSEVPVKAAREVEAGPGAENGEVKEVVEKVEKVPAAAEKKPAAEVKTTKVEQGPGGVAVTEEKKTTKKRSAAEGKGKKSKKAKA
ncbi:hypothetical protein KC332_g12787 [Hortaea werneckii]|uniref:RRM domain-containing protein n=2 Tax=Hortaea werneckii TaxID=91943 RepID=A0A3M7IZP5_HORWE|nr:hypothetical protein KC358_g6450 [Hortaea werneckii]OTA24710.1 hypothetical protein BTJ68_11075 [Hortaea werneckii EXF-2000]KAI6832881.1 hypothetical protein KC342_g7091 [Hortaea werneckii]KAI6838187.1 hypothetical protein KC350_g5901 [Hortaea werneckii]KAI6910732.1 hypothetical protein KC348_g13120 [Hortaea werneckii]